MADDPNTAPDNSEASIAAPHAGDSPKAATPASAEAEMDALIAELGPEKTREALELLLTEFVTKSDPEADA